LLQGKRKRGKWPSAALIVLLSATLGVLANWRAPGIGRYTRDWLMRQRGPLPAPADIAIVAIDEKSIREFGRFPWPRQVLAKTIDILNAADPKVLALDVLFPDPTSHEADETLARSIGRAGNVVLAAQLIDSTVRGGPAAWLMPMPALATAAAGIGHVNVQVESEGVARQLAVQVSDDAGETLRALPVEAVRIGDRAPVESVSFTGPALMVGGRAIPLDTGPPVLLIGQAAGRAPRRLQTGGMTIDYIGPAASFEPVTYSVADILHGTVPPASFRGKYVLIGATAASQGDRVASPFVHQTDSQADQHGSLMPGVEVLANALNTILRGRFYSETGDFGAFLWSALIAAVTLAAMERAQGKPEIARQTGALVLVGIGVLLAEYLEFARLLIFPPLVPGLISFASAGILGLLWRSLAASSRLDESIEGLSQFSEVLAAPPGETEPPERRWLPRGLEWKVQRVRELNSRLMERAQFIDQALRSVEDGLIIATAEGTIAFANRRAGDILQAAPRALSGQKLFDRLGLGDDDLLRRLTVERATVEREIEIRASKPRHYVLRMAAVAGEDRGGPVCGIVASLSDVTRQRELQQTKNDVISLVSHEMRTPLTAIQGMTELLANYDIEPSRRKEISSAINGEVKRLAGMITDYLDITRLESGATGLRNTPVKLDVLLQRILLLLEPLAAQRGIRLVLTPAAGLPAFFADADLLGRAVENLVSNAIKYSPDNTQVTVSAARDGESVAILVADQGYGIPEADLARVFEKFYRVPRVEDAGVPGTGLGLALVREIAELHGGTVTVASKINQGSTFTLRIPLARAGPAG
jgi:signal transduction histidine kinase/CHASE2 domain-containing sensor protein